MLSLRTGIIQKIEALSLKTATALPLEASGASDIEISFGIPTAATTLSVDIGGNAFYIAFVPALKGAQQWNVDVGYGPSDHGKKARYEDSLGLLSDDKELTLRVFLDGSVAECYWQGGRVAMTVPLHKVAASIGMTTDQVEVELHGATSYGMADIHTTKEDVLASPRLKLS